MSDEQIKTVIDHEIALEDSHPRGEKTKYFEEVKVLFIYGFEKLRLVYIQQQIKQLPLQQELRLIKKKH